MDITEYRYHTVFRLGIAHRKDLPAPQWSPLAVLQTGRRGSSQSMGPSGNTAKHVGSIFFPVHSIECSPYWLGGKRISSVKKYKKNIYYTRCHITNRRKNMQLKNKNNFSCVVSPTHCKQWRREDPACCRTGLTAWGPAEKRTDKPFEQSDYLLLLLKI